MSYYNGPYKFGKRSTRELATLHEDLQLVLVEAIQIIDFSIMCGHRDERLQNLHFDQGRTKLKWPQSNHNAMPSQAVDIAPYPINFRDNPKVLARFYMLMGMIYAISVRKKVKLRFGLDWSSDFIFTDQNFDDLVHIELAHP